MPCTFWGSLLFNASSSSNNGEMEQLVLGPAGGWRLEAVPRRGAPARLPGAH